MDNTLKTFFEDINPKNPARRGLAIHLATVGLTESTQYIEDYDVEYEGIETHTENEDEVPLGI
tara:strand:- start:1256 stop:1444 length:189 start_codon:yes stop_codon:yes gene_type:complete